VLPKEPDPAKNADTLRSRSPDGESLSPDHSTLGLRHIETYWQVYVNFGKYGKGHHMSWSRICRNCSHVDHALFSSLVGLACNIGISRELTYVGMSSKSALKDSEKEDIFGFVGAEMSKAAGARWV